jgi:hypothetical protein
VILPLRLTFDAAFWLVLILCLRAWYFPKGRNGV